MQSFVIGFHYKSSASNGWREESDSAWERASVQPPHRQLKPSITGESVESMRIKSYGASLWSILLEEITMSAMKDSVVFPVLFWVLGSREFHSFDVLLTTRALLLKLKRCSWDVLRLSYSTINLTLANIPQISSASMSRPALSQPDVHRFLLAPVRQYF